MANSDTSSTDSNTNDNIMFNNFLADYNSSSIDANNNNSNKSDANLIKFLTCNNDSNTTSLLQNHYGGYNIYQQQQQPQSDISTTIYTTTKGNDIISQHSNVNQFIAIQSANNTQSSTASLKNFNSNSSLQKQLKKASKKKSQITNEVDEERTSQLVLELLKNIKEKTKELESMNQNVKCSKSTTTATISSTLSSSSSSSSSQGPATNNLISLPPLSPSSSSSSSLSAAPINCQQASIQIAAVASPPPALFNTTSIRKPKRSSKILKAPKLNPNVLTQYNSACAARNTLIQISNTKQLVSDQQQEQQQKNSFEVLVPTGWKRSIDENGLVYYISPSNVMLKSKQEISNYLLSSNTCKCGLECPLDIDKIFNFDSKFASIFNNSQIELNKSCCLHILKQKPLENNNNNNESKSVIIKRKKNDEPKKKGRKPKQIKFQDNKESSMNNNYDNIKQNSFISSNNYQHDANNSSSHRTVNENKKPDVIQFKSLNKQKINSIISLDGYNSNSLNNYSYNNTNYNIPATNPRVNSNHIKNLPLSNISHSNDNTTTTTTFHQAPVTALFTPTIKIQPKPIIEKLQQNQTKNQNNLTDTYVLTTLSNCQIKLNNGHIIKQELQPQIYMSQQQPQQQHQQHDNSNSIIEHLQKSDLEQHHDHMNKYQHHQMTTNHSSSSMNMLISNKKGRFCFY